MNDTDQARLDQLLLAYQVTLSRRVGHGGKDRPIFAHMIKPLSSEPGGFDLHPEWQAYYQVSICPSLDLAHDIIKSGIDVNGAHLTSEHDLLGIAAIILYLRPNNPVLSETWSTMPDDLRAGIFRARRSFLKHLRGICQAKPLDDMRLAVIWSNLLTGSEHRRYAIYGYNHIIREALLFVQMALVFGEGALPHMAKLLETLPSGTISRQFDSLIVSPVANMAQNTLKYLSKHERLEREAQYGEGQVKGLVERPPEERRSRPLLAFDPYLDRAAAHILTVVNGFKDSGEEIEYRPNTETASGHAYSARWFDLMVLFFGYQALTYTGRKKFTTDQKADVIREMRLLLQTPTGMSRFGSREKDIDEKRQPALEIVANDNYQGNIFGRKFSNKIKSIFSPHSSIKPPLRNESILDHIQTICSTTPEAESNLKEWFSAFAEGTFQPTQPVTIIAAADPENRFQLLAWCFAQTRENECFKVRSGASLPANLVAALRSDLVLAIAREGLTEAVLNYAVGDMAEKLNLSRDDEREVYRRVLGLDGAGLQSLLGKLHREESDYAVEQAVYETFDALRYVKWMAIELRKQQVVVASAEDKVPGEEVVETFDSKSVRCVCQKALADGMGTDAGFGDCACLMFFKRKWAKTQPVVVRDQWWFIGLRLMAYFSDYQEIYYRCVEYAAKRNVIIEEMSEWRVADIIARSMRSEQPTAERDGRTAI